jgi:hypothetical protein
MSPVERVVVDAVESDEDEAKVDALDLGCGAYSPPPAAGECKLRSAMLGLRELVQAGRAPVKIQQPRRIIESTRFIYKYKS